MALDRRIAGLLRNLGSWFRRRERRLYPECLTRVGFDDRAVLCSNPDGGFQGITWPELERVVVQTTSDGPFLPDVFWELYAAGDTLRVVYPQGAIGEEGMLVALQERLPGFDSLALARAMGCAEDAVFEVWRRAGSPASDRAASGTATRRSP